MKAPLEIYISAADEDCDLLNALENHLAGLKRQGLATIWHRGKVLAGGDSHAEALAHLHSAQLVLLLVSADFIASDYCYDVEFTQALELHYKSKLRVVPIIMRPCNWKFPRLSELSHAALPKGDKAVITSRHKEQILTEIAVEVGNLLFSAPLETVLPSLPAEPDKSAGVVQARSLALPLLPEYYLPREEELATVRDLLLKGQTKTVGIIGRGKIGLQGMGGIGKSVMAAALLAAPEIVDKYSDGIFWLPVGQEPDLLLLQASLAQALGDTRPYTDPEKGREQLTELLADKACLIALDDVWEASHARYLGTPGLRGGLVLTSRKADVIDEVGATGYRLDLLNEGQALQLLALIAEQEVSSLPTIAREVAKECGYLPLALAMAGAMVYEQSWETILHLLKTADLSKIRRQFPDYAYPDLLKALEVSVLNLTSREQECYLDLAVFAEEEAIPLEALEVLWRLGRPETEKMAIRLGQAALLRWASQGRVILHDLQRDYVYKQHKDSLPALHRRLVEAYRSKCEGGEWSKGPDDGYYLQHLAYHLREAEQTTDLKKLLLDYDWLETKLQKVGFVDLLEDYSYLLDDTETRLVVGALKLGGYTLANENERNELWQQLYGRLLSRKELGIRHLLAHPPRRPWLRSLSPTMEQPGGPLLMTFAAHRWRVTAVAVLPDGKRAISVSEDGTLNVWDLDTGRALRTFEGHSCRVTAIAVLPDGRGVISASEDGTLNVWDLDTGRALRTFEGHNSNVNAIAVLPDGKRAISAYEDSTLKLWNLDTGQTFTTFKGHSNVVNAVAVLPDGRRAISASRDSTLNLWNLDTGRALRTFIGHRSNVNAVAVLPDGRRAISASEDRTLKLWDLDTGLTLRTLADRLWSVRAVAVLPDGKRAISAYEGSTLKLWNLDTGQMLATFKGHSDVVNAVAVLPDGRRAISASRDKTLKLWDLDTGQTFATFEGHSRRVNAVAVLPDGKRAISASRDKTLKLWNLDTGRALRTFIGHRSNVNAVAVLPDGKRAISATEDRTLKLWDLDTGQTLRTFEGHNSNVNAVAVLPDGRRAISASRDKTLKLWNLDTGRALRTFIGHRLSVNAVAVLPDGRRAISASYDDTLKLWDLDTWLWDLDTTGRALRTFEGHNSNVNAVAVLPDGRRAISASEDRTLKLWDLDTGQTLKTFEGHRLLVRAIAVLPDGKRAISAYEDRTLKLWDLDTGQILVSFSADAPLWSCAVLPDGKTFVAGDEAGKVYFLRYEEGTSEYAKATVGGVSSRTTIEDFLSFYIRKVRNGRR